MFEITYLSDNNDAIIWNDVAIQLLLGKVKELYHKVGTTEDLKSKVKMWQVISEYLLQEGHEYSPKQVQSKFRGMERQYKKCEAKNALNPGGTRISCVYQSELDEIFGKDIQLEKNIFNETSNETIVGNNFDVNQCQAEDLPKSNASYATQRRKEINVLARKTEKNRYHHTKFLNMMQEREKERKERARRKDERLERMLFLLESQNRSDLESCQSENGDLPAHKSNSRVTEKSQILNVLVKHAEENRRFHTKLLTILEQKEARRKERQRLKDERIDKLFQILEKSAIKQEKH